ncbi:hypothetical protein PQQ53_21405 [Paraburkholderia strydomiana]|uniref:hypothetical protein n=1 Tax=Paraburkholderia strydomiana TaxID=1245417 RepID=UPI0038BBC18E
MENMFETMALCDAINVPGYGESTSRCTVINKVSMQDRVMDAVHVTLATQAALSEVQHAWAVSAYDGAGKAREQATDTLCAAFASLHKNADLLRAVIVREFDHGETWCESFREIAKRTGLSHVTVGKVGERVRVAVSALRVETLARLKDAFQAKGWLA